VRVVDTTDGHGEMCGRFLADLGADVVLVEPIGGVASRTGLPAVGGVSFGFAVRAANKRSVELDLADADGRGRFSELLGAADVWIDGHRPGALAVFGFDPAEVCARFPRLVVAAITDFVLTGPYRDWVASDWELFALGGQLSRSGVPGRPPFMPPGDLADETSAIQAAWGVLLALWNREHSGAGDLLDISRFEATAQIVDPAFGSIGTAAAQSGTGVPDGRAPALLYPIFRCADGYVRIALGPQFLRDSLEPGTLRPALHGEASAPWGVYRCAGDDEWCTITAREDTGWSALVAAIGAPDWATDPQVKTTAGRCAARHDIDRGLDAWTATRPSREVMDVLQGAGVAAGAMTHIADLPADPQIVARGFFRHMRQPGLEGDVPVENGPCLARNLAEPELHPAPYDGQHTREICRTLLGLDDAAIDDLVAHGVLDELSERDAAALGTR
jgi:crotonobetainyl-CoA:carnitine CoA-transferase CaiB-like acyl-CoA transferase